MIDKIRAALETKLNSINPPIETVWENFNYDPELETPYQEPTLLFTRPDNLGFGDGPYLQRGYMQVSLRYPLGNGSGDATERARLLRDTFFRGLSLAKDGVTTVIEETPEVPAGAIEGDRFVINVRIRFYASIN